MRTGGAYVRDPDTGQVKRVSEPLKHHPEGNGARDAAGKLIAVPPPAPVAAAAEPAPEPEPAKADALAGRRGKATTSPTDSVEG